MITVARYTSKEEAYVAKALLEAAEIQVFIDDARLSEDGFIEIRVPQKELERARALLADREETIQGVAGEKGGEVVSPKRGEGGDILLFLKGGGLWVIGYVFLALLLMPFGVRTPMAPIVFGGIFLLGGLVALTFGSKARRSRSSQ